MNSVIKFKNNKQKKLVPFYSNSKLETIIHVDMDSIFESICSVIMAKRRNIGQKAWVGLLIGQKW